jgi:hypothetical protein
MLRTGVSRSQFRHDEPSDERPGSDLLYRCHMSGTCEPQAGDRFRAPQLDVPGIVESVMICASREGEPDRYVVWANGGERWVLEAVLSADGVRWTGKLLVADDAMKL